MVAHLSTAELGQRYRAARQPIERSHLQIVWLLSQGRREREVAAVTGYGQRWITEIVRRYNAEGASGLGDQRARNIGARPLRVRGAALVHLAREPLLNASCSSALAALACLGRGICRLCASLRR